VSSSEGLNVPINVNVVGQSQATSLIGILRELGTVFEATAGSSTSLTTKSKETADAESATLGVYSRALGVLKEYGAASEALSQQQATETEVVNRLSGALENLAVATTAVVGTDREAADAQSNTLRLYQQVLAISQQSVSITNTEANTKLTLARAENELAKSKLASAKASAEEIAAQRAANGQGAPLTDKQAGDLAMRQSQQQLAAAIRETQAAEAAEAATRRAATAASKEAAAALQTTAAAEREEAAAAKAAAASQEEQSTSMKSTANSAGSAQFALYQVAYAYKYISQAALAVGTAPITVAESFQTSFAQVVRTLDVGAAGIEGFGGQIAVLRNSLISLSENIPVAFEKLSQIATTGNQLGIGAADVENFTNVVAQFSALTNVSADAAATYFGRITNLLGVLPSQYTNLASAVVDLGVKSAATETEILAVTQNIAGAVRTAGYGTPEVLGLATALASLKIPPELSRSTLTRLLSNITTAVDSGGPKLEAYAKVLGVTAQQAQALGKQSPEAFFQGLVQGLSNVNINGGNVNEVLKSIGVTSIRDQSVLQKLSNNYDLLASSIREGVSAYKDNSELGRQSAYVFGTLSAKVQETKDAFAAFLDSVGSQTLTPLVLLADAVKNIIVAFTDLPNFIKNPIFALALIVGAIAAFRGALALAAAGLIAFRQVVGSELGGAGVSIGSFFALLRNEAASGAAATTAAANTIAESNARIAGSISPVTTALAAESAAMLEQAAIAQTSALKAASYGAAIRLQGLGLTQASESLLANSAALTVNTTEQDLNSVAKRLNVIATGIETGSLGAESVAYTESTAATLRSTAALYENAAAARASGAANVASAAETATSSVARSGAALGGLSSFFGGPVGIGVTVGLTALAAFLPGLIEKIKGVNTAEEDAAAKTKEMNDAFISSVGGAQALKDAITKDTQAFVDSGNQMTAQNGITQVYKTNLTDLHNGQAIVTQGWYDMNGAPISDLTTKQYAFADSTTQSINNQGAYQTGIKGSAAAQDGLGRAVGLTTNQLNQQAVALGNTTKALTISGLFSQAIGADGTGGKIFSADDLAKLKLSSLDVGQQISEGVKDGLNNKKPELDATFQKLRDDLVKQLAQANADYTKNLKDNNDTLGITGNTSGQIKALQDEINKIDQFKDAIGQAGISIGNTSAYSQALAGALKAAGVATDEVIIPTDTAGASIDALGVAATTTNVGMKDLASSFHSAIGDMFTLINNAGALTNALDKLGTSIASNGTNFSTATDAGRQNLAALESVVNAQGAILEKGITDGKISAEEAGKQLKTFVTGLANQLASQGVDTSQISFLVDYVDRVTKNPAIWSVGVDTSAGIAGINQLLIFAQQAQAYVAGLGATSSFGQDVDKAAAVSASRTGSNGYVALTKYGTPPDYSQVATNGGVSNASIIQQATDVGTVADEWKKAQAAAQAATSAAKSNGAATNQAAQQATKNTQAASQAASQAAAVEAKHLEYLKAVGSYYASIGKEAFAASDAENNVIVKLQDLGTSVGNNGVQFNNTTKEGQANITALSNAFDAYGASLSTAISNGSLSVDQAQVKLQTFGAGVRQSLAGAGVPASELSNIFTQLGITGTEAFSKNNNETSKYVGVLGQAAQAAKDAFNVGTINKASAATQALTQYTKDLATYYGTLGTNLFASIDAEGNVFATIQKLGDAVATNGKGFNNVTQLGRDNLSALRDTLEAESKLLSEKVTAGKETAAGASRDFAQFAGGIYKELLGLGVSATSVKAIFSGLGIDSSGFDKASQSVKQYAGVLTDAEKAAAALTATNTKAAAAAVAAADYSKRLATALADAYGNYHDLANAADATSTAILGIRNSYQAARDSVLQLRDANRSLHDDINAQQVIVDKANNDYLLSLKYGQTAEAASFKSQRDTAQTKIAQDQTTVATNNTTIDTTQAGIGNLKGDTKDAIDNRKSLEDLQNTMLLQIDAYAKTGASTQDVTQYTKDLEAQFDKTAKQAGYSASDIKVYNTQFAAYAAIVKSVPQTVVTSLTVQGVSSATAALNSLPKSGSYITTATADIGNAKAVLATIPKAAPYAITVSSSYANRLSIYNALRSIPQAAQYKVTATLANSPSAVGAALRNGIGSGGNYTVNPTLSAAGLAALRNQLLNVAANTSIQFNSAAASVLTAFGINLSPSGFGINAPSMNVTGAINAGHLNQRAFFEGGLVNKYASGGFVPGTPPSNPKQDNILAAGPNGLISIRSGEFVQSQPAVDYYGLAFMQSVNNLKFPRTPQFYAGGPAGGPTYGPGTGGTTVVNAGLTAADRRAIVGAGNRPVNVTITTRQVQDAQTNFQAQQNQAGRN
jgi:hypothetical protein